jgi:Ca2+-transporting ATPase
MTGGLSSAAAAELLRRHGPNTAPTMPRRPVWRRIASALREPLVLVLLVAATLTALTGDLSDTIVIALVVVANTTLAVWQEVRADRAVTALSQLAAPMARVVRDGREANLPATQIVPGDLVLLGEGDIVPADGVLLEAAGLRVDESSLTGESVPVDKTVSSAGRNIDRGSVYSATTVVHGRGRVRITATGADGTLGRIGHLLQMDRVATPLQRRMARLSLTLATAVVTLCLIVLGLGLLRGQSLELMLLTAISLAVAAVPESLPVVVTLSLALAARRMTRRRAIVRSLPAVETLGSVTLLATDKTGTLTEGRMTCEWLECASGVTESDLLRAAVLCNDARLGDGNSPGMGDPTEIALLVAARDRGLERHHLEQTAPRVAEEPFDSSTKRMLTEHVLPDRSRLSMIKGAPEALLGVNRLVDSPEAAAALRRAHEWAAAGHRVLAFVETSVNASRFLGLVALHDPPRLSASATIAACRQAGIRPVLITGDHAATAAAIAEIAGIGPAPAIDLTGLDLADPAQSFDSPVLARATPEQKLQAVIRWQADGEVVAMTGDGVNDAPALRRADIGVAMGDRGTEVARQAADVILADDELGTVIAAVEEGRRVYANIRRFLLYALSGGAAEILVMLAGPFLGMVLPLLPAQILWVNLLTHSLAGTALGAEPTERGTMSRPPRDPAEGVLGGGLWWRILVLSGGIAAAALTCGVLVDGALAVQRSAVMISLGAGQLGVALGARVRRAARDEANPALPITVVAASLLLIGAVTLAPLQVLLSTAPVPGVGWLAAIAIAAAGWVGARMLTRGPAVPRSR